MLKIIILSALPLLFPGTLATYMLEKSRNKLWTLELKDLRKTPFQFDDKIYGAGAGMIIKPEPVAYYMDEIISFPANRILLYMSPRGETFNQALAEKLSSQYDELVFLCGRYEGIDARVINYYNFLEISLGDFILCGGEVAAMAIIEAILRLRPGILGNIKSKEQETFSLGLVEENSYTRPSIWRNMSVPEILLSGHEKNIKYWRLRESIEITKEKRPDLYYNFCFYIFFIFLVVKFEKNFSQILELIKN